MGWLEDCRVRSPGFSYYGSRSFPALDASLQDIAGSDVVVLIVGHLYGMIAPGLNHAQEEHEYAEAQRLGKTLLVYLREEKAGRIPGSVEKDPQKVPLLADFRARLEKENTVRWFRDPFQLTAKIEEDLVGLLDERKIERKPVGRNTIRGRAKSTTPEKPTSGDAQFPGENQESETRTLPILQKALSTPFSPSMQPRKRRLITVAITLVIILLLAIVGVWRGKWITTTLPSSHAMADSVQSSAMDTSAGSTPDSALSTDSPAEPPYDPLAELLENAKAGDTTALLKVAVMYDSGQTLPHSDTLATQHYRLAASKGMPEAQYRLGMRHLTGDGAKKSRGLAAYWIDKSANAGYAPAQAQLGLMYLKGGQGVIRDESAGFKWLLKAADQGNQEAKAALNDIKSN